MINIQVPPLHSYRINSARPYHESASTNNLLLHSARSKNEHRLRSLSNYLFQEYVTTKHSTEMSNTCLKAQKFDILKSLRSVCTKLNKTSKTLT
jgi:hypothetical protein